MAVNRGFVFDAGDPSVGMFGTEWVHEECPDPESRTLQGVYDVHEVDETPLSGVRIDDMTVRFWILLTCLDCGQQVLVHRDDCAPTFEVVEAQEADWNAWAAAGGG